MWDSFKFSGQALQEAKKNFNRSEEVYCKTKKNEKTTLCPTSYMMPFTYCSPNKNIKTDLSTNEGLYKVFMAKQEIYQESEKLYNEKVSSLLEVMKSTCAETIKKAQKSYIKIKSLYDKGIVSFFEDEKKTISDEFPEKKQQKKGDFCLNYETPIKDLRKSPSFSNFDSDVRLESAEQNKNNTKMSNNCNSEHKNAVKYLTFNEKKE